MALVLKIGPEVNGLEAPLHDFGVLPFRNAMHLKPVEEIVLHGKRKGIWPLKHHADVFSQLDNVDAVKWPVVDKNRTGNLHIVNEVVHAVKAAQQR